MNASRIGAIVLRMFYLYRGSPQRVFPIFILVAIDILVWGFLTRYLNSVSHADFNFVPALLGAVLLWDFLTRVMQQMTMTLFEDVWTRNFLNFFASPLRTSEYLVGLLIVAITTSGLSLDRHARACANRVRLVLFLLRDRRSPLSSWCCSSPALRSASPPRPWCCGSGPPPNGSSGRSRC